jgi:UDP-2,4-diacetamido-2,4,6-trideoxy-beta-L-altropyranose hydrolase
LGTSPTDDANETANALRNRSLDWLIVDHYALDADWERAVLPPGARLMVIDDLANRPHVADLLLDQNLGRLSSDYDGLVPDHCQRLIGPSHALLRPEFAKLRPNALARRPAAQPHHLLITMGGVDAPDATGRVLRALQTIASPASRLHYDVTVVLGSNALWRAQISDLVTRMPCPTRLLVDTPDMAKLMVRADLAIGAAGSTSWERCCLALPALTVILADNQREAAAHLARAGATHVLALDAEFEQALHAHLAALASDTSTLHLMSQRAAEVVDGLGAQRVSTHMSVCTAPFVDLAESERHA